MRAPRCPGGAASGAVPDGRGVGNHRCEYWWAYTGVDVEKILLAGRWRLHMNYAALVAALGSDFGLSPREFYLFMIPVFLGGMPPCYLGAAKKPEGLLFPLPCRVMLYEGVPRRRWGAAK